MAKFTPEDVVRRYHETGVRPRRGSMNIRLRDGRWEVKRLTEGCCAIGVMLVGETVSSEARSCSSDEGIVAAEQLGIDFLSFASGFDCVPGDLGEVEDDFKLGRACREAVEREFGALPLA